MRLDGIASASPPHVWMILPQWKDVSQIDRYNSSTCNHVALQLATHNRDVVVHYQNTMHKNLGEGQKQTEGCLQIVGLLSLH